MRVEQLNSALESICQNLGGDWLLLGGSLVRILMDPHRGTHDLDIVSIDHPTDVVKRARLFEEMKKLGLSPEQVNSAVYFFLNQAEGWQRHVRPFRTFASGTLYRPTLTLFAFLKLGRATEIDLADLELAKRVWGVSEFDAKQFRLWANPELRQRAADCGLPCD